MVWTADRSPATPYPPLSVLPYPNDMVTENFEKIAICRLLRLTIYWPLPQPERRRSGQPVSSKRKTPAISKKTCPTCPTRPNPYGTRTVAWAGLFSTCPICLQTCPTVFFIFPNLPTCPKPALSLSLENKGLGQAGQVGQVYPRELFLEHFPHRGFVEIGKAGFHSFQLRQGETSCSACPFLYTQLFHSSTNLFPCLGCC